jgi:hypothetical protein
MEVKVKTIISVPPLEFTVKVYHHKSEGDQKDQQASTQKEDQRRV